MQIDLAQDALSSKLEGVHAIDEQILAGNRVERGKPVGRYVFDFTGKLREAAARLDEYQDRILAKSFFDLQAHPDLRWNHYLFFVAPNDVAKDKEFTEAKQIIECDQTYARKFVIADDEFALTLSRLDSVAEAKGGADRDIVEVWAELLIRSGLACVLEEDRSIADTARMIASGRGKNTTRARRATGTDAAAKLASSTLTRVDTRQFRTYPATEPVTLGKFNLLFGPNGVGKTSFLEAIEFLYSGEVRRHGAASGARVTATLSSGDKVTTSSSQPLSDFDSRVVSWFGGHRRTPRNALPDYFGRFCFLNTDAAAEVSFGREGRTVAENTRSLAALVSGARATALWDRFQAVQRACREQLSRAVADNKRLDAEIRLTETELRSIAQRPRPSDAELLVLKETLASAKWKAIPDGAGEVDAGFLEALSSAASSLGLTQSLSWFSGTLSLGALERERKRLESLESAIDSAGKKVRNCEKRLGKVQGARIAAVERAEKIRKLHDVSLDGLGKTLRELQEVERIVSDVGDAALLEPVATFDYTPVLGLFPLGVKDALRSVEHTLKAELSTLATVQAARNLIAKQSAELSSLHSELHAIAQRILDHSDSHSCPLCASEFSPGVLQQRMAAALSAAVEGDLPRLTEQVGLLTAQTASLQSQADALALIWRHLVQLRRTDSTLGQAVQLLQDRHRMGAIAHVRRLALRTELARFKKGGLDPESVAELLWPSGNVSLSRIDAQSRRVALEAAERKVATLADEEERELRAVEAARASLNATLNAEKNFNGLDVDESTSLTSHWRNQLSGVIDEAQSLEDRLALGPRSDLRLIYSYLASALLTATSVEASVSAEHAANSRVGKLETDRQRLVDRRAKGKKEEENLSHANSMLSGLIEKHSLLGASESTIAATHEAASEIFSRIHTPCEYSITTDLEAPLLRISDRKKVSLSEISTGQRAAYALSIFLAMNARCEHGPKVVLLDDPISHIDDLNVLSVLDYLRNLVLRKNKQVFFATADERLAGLIEHKFGFLDEDYCPIELSR